MTKRNLVCLAAFVLGLTSCAPAALESTRITQEAAKDLNQSFTCEDARSEVFGTYFRAHEAQPRSTEGLVVDAGVLRTALAKDLGAASPDLSSAYVSQASKVHRILEDGITGLVLSADTAEERDPLLHLARLEMRSELSPEYVRINAALDEALGGAKAAALSIGLTCAGNESVALLAAKVDAHQGDARFGALKTMATAYQSCNVLDLSPVTSDVEEVRGVIRYNKVDSVGWGRKYTDVALLKKTHYYHRGQSYSGSCASQNAKPLVYDYGGAPGIDSKKSVIDVFANSGGGPALGIDCSAFISTANAMAGNLYKPSTANRPVYTRFTSYDYINAKKSGWGCYENVEVSGVSTIKPGDIAAVHGHVVMVDTIGSDPLGIARARTVADCSAIDKRKFDFTILQSSSSKEHLGINRYIGADYSVEAEKIGKMFGAYAKAACLAKFDGKKRNPVTADFGIIRHKGGAGCLAPRVTLAREECVATCTR